ncbi:MAG: GlsB/YeaQ/YmgE family stress response membrane protein [Endomicrobiales bacterium]|nr:GlsB/YeaQ/YmgE family stress response membrane protein [Endomicrobiales bacterium]
MASKKIIMIGMVVGSVIGGYVPKLFGISGFSFTALFTSGIGAVIGIWLEYKISK